MQIASHYVAVFGIFQDAPEDYNVNGCCNNIKLMPTLATDTKFYAYKL